MDEVENTGVMQETATEIAAPETETEQVEQSKVEDDVQREERNQRNWTELRKSKDEWERKAKLQEELLQRLMTQHPQVQTASIAPEPEQDILQEIAKEEYPAGEKVAKSLRKIEQNFEKKLQEVEKKYAIQAQKSLFSELKEQYPDFDSVVTPENIQILEESNPRLASAIAATKDPYSIALQSYEYIKAKGISNMSRRSAETDAKLSQNKKTVTSPQSQDKRPMAQAFSSERLTKEQKKTLHNEMLQYANQAGMGY